MARFELRNELVRDAAGDETRCELIVDRSTLERVVELGCGIDTTTARGYVRCVGPEFVGKFGRYQPIYGDSEIYYEPYFLFDGHWKSSSENSRGTYSYVTEKSGTGKLFAALENFWRKRQLASAKQLDSAK